MLKLFFTILTLLICYFNFSYIRRKFDQLKKYIQKKIKF